MTTPKTILVVDDHPMFREAVSHILRSRCPTALILEAGSMAEAEQHAAASPPDLLMLDLLFPGMNPPDSIQQLRQAHPTASIVVVSMLEDPETASMAIASGADGFIAKSVNSDAFVAALDAIEAGEFVVKVSDGVSEPGTSPPWSGLPPTERQVQILNLIHQGKTNKEIGRSLAISPFTVRNHISVLFRIFGAAGRAELLKKALALGVLSLTSEPD